MSCYVGSNDNRFYVSLESQYGAAAPVDANNRCGGIRLKVRQERSARPRRDKTGSRTYWGNTGQLRRSTTWHFSTYLTGSGAPGAPSRQAPFFEAGLGGTPRTFGGAAIASVTGGTSVTCSGAHGLQPGQAILASGDLRFVSAVVDGTTFIVTAPLSGAAGAGAVLSPTVTFQPATDLRSISLYDCWSPATAVQRLLYGGAVDELAIRINGDYHEVEFSGPAADVLDSASFSSGQGGLSTFPSEPVVAPLEEEPIPGHLGQFWIGAAPARLYNVTGAEVKIKNNVETRNREFGSDAPRCLVAGTREVTLDFTLFEQGTSATRSLYEAARQQSPVSLTLQLGEQPGKICGIWIRSVVPEVPDFEDSETRLRWRFRPSLAQGSQDDEVSIAFA